MRGENPPSDSAADAPNPPPASRRVVGILQPGYLPWLGFFEQLARCDVFVLYDDVQYDKHGWRNRNRIKTPAGAHWLTVPVLTRGQEMTRVMDVRIDNAVHWRRKHLLAIRQNYARAPFLERYIGRFDQVYARDWQLLVDLDIHLIRELAECLGIDLGKKPLLRSSQMGIEGDRIGRLVAICKAVGADTFYEGAAGRDYIDPADFARHDIEVMFQNYVHPAYSQLHGEFVPYLSAVDLLLNHGPASLDILTGRSLSKEPTP